MKKERVQCVECGNIFDLFEDEDIFEICQDCENKYQSEQRYQEYRMMEGFHD